MKKGLFALALGTFTLGIAEFIIEGIITDIAHNMNVSIPEAGHLISIYALGVCAGAFSLILMHKYRPKNILMFLASLITFGAVIASVAPNYWLLLCARFIEGLPHGAYFGTGVNAQKRCVAIHHLDTPWRPSDLQQRDGRGVRAGNEIAKHFALEEVCFSIAVQRYNYLFKLQTKSIIFIAVIAHSSPLLPSLPPARSSACSIVLVVINP
jgi:hypothetical protein